jgi:hypothetical protein
MPAASEILANPGRHTGQIGKALRRQRGSSKEDFNFSTPLSGYLRDLPHRCPLHH